MVGEKVGKRGVRIVHTVYTNQVVDSCMDSKDYITSP